MAARLASVGDLWAALPEHRQSLARAAESVLQRISPEELETALSAATRKPAAKKTSARKKT
jgi:hypothetical protein